MRPRNFVTAVFIFLFSLFFTLAYAQKSSSLDTTAIEKITGIKGKANKGEYKITIPQNDLDVEVYGF